MEGNIIDYVDWRGDLSFRQSPVNSIDGLIFSALAYINFNLTPNEERALSDIAVAWNLLPEDEKFRGFDSLKPDYLVLMEKCAHSRRFSGVTVTHFREKTSLASEGQFAAVSFILPGGDVFVAFRGTDESLVGWKEDFNMAFMSGTPAQLSATAYLSDIASVYPSAGLYTGGHSKGGNLAVWSAVNQPKEVRDRIKHIYSNDGPGFSDNLTETAEYGELKKRIMAFVPESSIVGVLMGCCDYYTVKSRAVISVNQHHPFTWKVVGRRFVYDAERTGSGKFMERKINDLIKTLGKDEIEKIVNEVYSELVSDNEKEVKDLNRHLIRHLYRNLNTIARLHRKRTSKKQ